jgi:hypothetical protein
MACPLEQDGEARLLEQVHVVVTGHGVGAQADGDTSRDEFRERRDTVTELGVGRRAVGNRALLGGDGRDVARVDANAVNQEGTRSKYLERGEELDGRRCARRHSDLSRPKSVGEGIGAASDELLLDLALGDVDSNGKTLRARVIRDGAKEGVGDGIRRVRRSWRAARRARRCTGRDRVRIPPGT